MPNGVGLQFSCMVDYDFVPALAQRVDVDVPETAAHLYNFGNVLTIDRLQIKCEAQCGQSSIDFMRRTPVLTHFILSKVCILFSASHLSSCITTQKFPNGHLCPLMHCIIQSLSQSMIL